MIDKIFLRTVVISTFFGLVGAASMLTQTTREACLLLNITAKSDNVTTVSWDALDNADTAFVSIRAVGTHDWIPYEAVHAKPWTIDFTDTSDFEVQVIQSQVSGSIQLVNSGYAQIHRTKSTAFLATKKVLLIVDAETLLATTTQLQRFIHDLRCEGWVVKMSTVAATSSVALVKGLIYDSYADSANGRLSHVILIGSIPYATSGGFNVKAGIPNPDYHPEHGGAWASDAYYADLYTSNGIGAEYQWTDSTVNITDTAVAKRNENQNVPGDGKWDNSVIPTNADVCVGRITMADLPDFGTSTTSRNGEFELIKRYLDKNHRYRTHEIEPPRRALIDDVFGVFSYVEQGIRFTESFASSGWRSFAPIVGAGNIVSGDWIPDKQQRPSLDTFGVLLSYGCGPGGYEHCDFVANSKELATHTNLSVFTLLFGSYFGDVASTNNMLRSVLAQEGWTLTSGWSGRPHWQLHKLAAGLTIGECAQASANNGSDYLAAFAYDSITQAYAPYPLGNRGIHIMLLGDPTLRVQGPYLSNDISITELGNNAITLTWEAALSSTNDIASIHYVVEVAPSIEAPFTIATSTSLTTATIDIADNIRFIRVRPYYTSANYPAPLPGRGIIEARPVKISDVNEPSIIDNDANNLLYYDLTGSAFPTVHAARAAGPLFAFPKNGKGQMHVIWK